MSSNGHLAMLCSVLAASSVFGSAAASPLTLSAVVAAASPLVSVAAAAPVLDTLGLGGIGLKARQATNGIGLEFDTLPMQGGNGALPVPAPGATLKYVTVGRGTQNYTCADEAAAPVAAGAVAEVYDMSQLPQFLFEAFVNVGLNTSRSEFPDDMRLERIGTHYFDAATPVFDFGTKGVFRGAKKANVSAPAEAAVGPAGTGAIDWLHLGDSGSVGFKEAYRVGTAGGKAPKTCTGKGARFEIDYASQYWFY
ncbi:MAG: hypothetical protein M1832_002632 [Thelocarpon impressellum]|nr:MAG: hypothetical protein M1832_002632 [Thelocarpon impressellum]